MVRTVALLLGVHGLILAVCDARIHTLDLKVRAVFRITPADVVLT